MDYPEFEDDEKKQKYNYWSYFCIFLYALFVTFENAFVNDIAEFVVNAMNVGQDSEYEQNMTKYIFNISSLYAYSGLFILAYLKHSFSLCNMLMIMLHILQRIGLNLYEYAQPYRTMPKKFAKHKAGLKPHCRKYPDDYEQFSSRQVHLEIEQQTLMRDMPNTRMEGYNEMVLEFGWINLFAPVFPASALLAIFSNLLQLSSEKDSIGRFTKRGTPMGALDIGGWLEYFEFLAVIGTINSVGLVIFTS